MPNRINGDPDGSPKNICTANFDVKEVVKETRKLTQREKETSEKEFMGGESLGCEPPRRCIRCRGCKDCAYRGVKMSAKEARELEIMESKISFDKSIGKCSPIIIRRC